MVDTQNSEGSIKNPRQLVRLVIIAPEDSQKIFVARDIRSHKGHCFLPGGGIESGENIEQAAKRELLEEAGISFNSVLKLDKLFEFPHEWDNNGTPFYEVNHVMACAIKPDALNTALSQEAHLQFEWLNVAELQDEVKKFRPQEMVKSLLDAISGSRPSHDLGTT